MDDGAVRRILAGHEQDRGAHQLRMPVQWGCLDVLVASGHRVGHPGRGTGCQRVHAHVVVGPLLRQDVHQSEHAHLRGTVVRLSEVAEYAGTRTGEDDAPVVLGVHQRPCRVRHVGGAVQMDVDDDVPLVEGHVLECLVAQDAGVVDQDVDPAERVHGGLHDGLRTFPIGDGGFVGDRDTARGLNLGDHRIRGIALSRAVDAAAQVVHYHFRSTLGELQRVAPSYASTGPGDDCDFSFELTHLLSRCQSQFRLRRQPVSPMRNPVPLYHRIYPGRQGQPLGSTHVSCVHAALRTIVHGWQ